MTGDVLICLPLPAPPAPHPQVYKLPGQHGSTTMQGLDSLAARLEEYKKAGAVFAKWRSPLEINQADGQPSDLVINANMEDLARYALICQARRSLSAAITRRSRSAACVGWFPVRRTCG